MDINGLSDLYSTKNPFSTAQTSKSANDISKLDHVDMSNATDDELMDVCQEFEAYFLEQVMKEMTKTIGADEENDSNSTMVNYFKDSTLAELSKQATKQNSYGLAQTLYDQMKRNYI